MPHISSLSSSTSTIPGGVAVSARADAAAAGVSVPGNRGIKLVRAVVIRAEPQALYAFWRNVSNLPRIVHHPVTIEVRSPTESHWVVSAPAGWKVEWDSIIINDEPGKLIAWRSRPGGDVNHAGSIRFEPAPGDEGTEVTVSLEYDPPGRKIGAAIARLTRDSAGSQVDDALRRFKALMEAAEAEKQT